MDSAKIQLNAPISFPHYPDFSSITQLPQRPLLTN